MPAMRHPLSGAIYDVDTDGSIVVTKDGESGRFTAAGEWLSGAIRYADPHLCGWLSGPRMASHHAHGPTKQGAAS